MSDLAIWNALGQGVQRGLVGYQEAQKRRAEEDERQVDRQMRQEQFDIERAKSHLQKNPNTGKYELDDVGQELEKTKRVSGAVDDFNKLAIGYGGLVGKGVKSPYVEQLLAQDAKKIGSLRGGSTSGGLMNSQSGGDFTPAATSPRMTPASAPATGAGMGLLPVSSAGEMPQQGGEQPFFTKDPNYRSPQETYRAQGQATRMDFKLNEARKALKDDIDPDKNRAGNFGQISNRHLKAQNLAVLARDAQGNIANLPSVQQQELAEGMANLITGGGASSEGRVMSLVPKSLRGDTQKVKSWLLNAPLGADQQKFTQMMLDTIDREATQAQKQMGVIMKRRLAAHKFLKQHDPEGFNSILQSYGLDGLGDLEIKPLPGAIEKPLEGKERGLLNAPKGAAAIPKGYITVSNGKETLAIPQEEVINAEKDGFKVVK